MKIKFLILFLYLAKEGFEYFVRYLNLRHMKAAGTEAPPELRGKVDEDVMRKMVDYEAENTRFGFFSGAADNAVAVVFIWGGALDVFNSWIAGLGLSFAAAGWLFFLLLFYAGQLLGAPFGLYHTFRIENKYGFNTMGFRLWGCDFSKSLLIETAIITALAFAGFALVGWSPRHWWFWVWGFLFIFGIFIMYISPYLIEPLFNKFVPVEDEALRQEISKMAGRAGIRVSRVLKVDASKRSRHTNAYFTGIGRTKRIVLFDTLLQGMDHKEILSVLAHEIGHWKKKHLLKTMALFEAASFAGLWAASILIRSDMLTRIFGLSADTVYAKLLLLGLVAGIFSLPLRATANYLSRRHEKEADAFSRGLADGNGMISALVKLSRENLSNLNPHPLFVALYYSHPPVAERIRYIEAMK